MGSYSSLPHLWMRPGNRTWYIVWQYAGKPMRRSTGETKYARAQAALRAFVESGQHSTPDLGRLTLGEAAQRWIQARSGASGGLRPKTVAEYALTADRVARSPASRLRVSEAGPDDVRQFLAWLERREKVGPAGVARALTHLRMLWTWLEKQQLATRNPARLVDRPKREPKRPAVMTPAAWERLQADLAADMEDSTGGAAGQRERQMLADFLALLWHSGLRGLEATRDRLRWTDLDLEAATITVRSPLNKGGTVTLPLAASLLPMLRRRRLLGGSGPFPGEWETRGAWRRFQARWPAWKAFGLHSLRHGFVSRIRASHADPAASVLARHKSKSMTDHYSHFDAEAFREALD